MKTSRQIWRTVIMSLALVLVVITFTPLVLSPGRITPVFMSMPYTLWATILITIILVVLTYLYSRVRDDD